MCRWSPSTSNSSTLSPDSVWRSPVGIRNSKCETLVVPGDRSAWLTRCTNALRSAGFSGIEERSSLYQIEAKYRRLTVWGGITVILLPSGGSTDMRVEAWANADNVYAAFSSPTGRIIREFKANLDTSPVPPIVSGKETAPHQFSGRFRVVGVDRESKLDTSLVVHAESTANARAKGELQGIIVTNVTTLE